MGSVHYWSNINAGTAYCTLYPTSNAERKIYSFSSMETIKVGRILFFLIKVDACSFCPFTASASWNNFHRLQKHGKIRNLQRWKQQLKQKTANCCFEDPTVPVYIDNFQLRKNTKHVYTHACLYRPGVSSPNRQLWNRLQQLPSIQGSRTPHGHYSGRLGHKSWQSLFVV